MSELNERIESMNSDEIEKVTLTSKDNQQVGKDGDNDIKKIDEEVAPNKNI